MKKMLTIGFILISSLSLQAQEPIDLIENFFESYFDKGAEFAVQELYDTNPWTVRIKDAIENVKSELAKYDEDLVGKCYGYEELLTKNLGESYVLHSYFLKFDRQFMRLTFQFYKPDDKWMLASFQFDDKFDDELEEAAKMYFIDFEKNVR